MAKGGVLTSSKSLDLVVRFNCQAAGKPIITVRIPFADDTLEDVVFSFIKDNAGTGLDTSEHQGFSFHKGFLRFVGLVSRQHNPVQSRRYFLCLPRSRASRLLPKSARR